MGSRNPRIANEEGRFATSICSSCSPGSPFSILRAFSVRSCKRLKFSTCELFCSKPSKLNKPYDQWDHAPPLQCPTSALLVHRVLMVPTPVMGTSCYLLRIRILIFSHFQSQGSLPTQAPPPIVRTPPPASSSPQVMTFYYFYALSSNSGKRAV